MRNNYLEILLCENLIKTYSSLILRKEMYYQVIKNIQNILIFPIFRFKFKLSQINDTKLLIEYFKETNKYLLQEGDFNYNNLVIFQIDLSFKINLFKSYSKEETTFFIFPEKNLIFQLNKNLKKLYMIKYTKKKIKIQLDLIPQNILYLKDNLFISQYSEKLILYSFETKGFVENKNFCYNFNKIYSKIIEIKNDGFVCSSQREVDFFSYNPDSKMKLLFLEKKIHDVAFIKRINENLILFSYETYFYFMDDFGKEIKKINLYDKFLIENQICVYHNNYLIMISTNLTIYLIDLISLTIMKYFNFYSLLLKEVKIYKDDIMCSENNKSTLYCGKCLNSEDIKILNKHDNRPLIVENKYGLIIYNNGYFYLLYNVENNDTVIIELYHQYGDIENMFLYEKQIYLIHEIEKWNKEKLNYISFFE